MNNINLNNINMNNINLNNINMNNLNFVTQHNPDCKTNGSKTTSIH